MRGTPPSFRIGAVDDAAEREADAVADRVLRRKCDACEEEERLSRRAGGGAVAADAGAAVRAVQGDAGQALRAEDAVFFGSTIGPTAASARIHDGPAADRAARSVGARAFALGQDVVFARGEYRPDTSGGRRLLAHELAHVAQADGILRRQGGAGSGCEVSVCFVPIRMMHLDLVDARHAVINVTLPGGVQQRAEVDPMRDQGVEDPAAVGSGIGRAAGLHSHVSIATGHRTTGGACTILSHDCGQANAVLASARRYEELDVVYEPPPGPNSNSFGEWVLTDAGLPTAGVAAPMGAAGWGFYTANPGARANPPRVARTRRAEAARCTAPVRRATTFQALVDLVRAAETQLIACGVTDAGERVHILRGIYYGTPWSADFGTSQQSHVRSQMFNAYTGSTQPRYPLECMDCGTFLSLGASQDINDGGRLLDVGHMFIGMDARRSTVARTVPQPVGQVTGLEAATWAGDLGGGAARLALRRIATPTTGALNYFRGTDYGGPINLEGDIAGYMVATGGAGGVAPLAIPAGGTVADSLAAYLLPPTSGGAAGRDTRCTGFLGALGGTFSGTTLTNRAAVLAYIAEQVLDFGCWYLVNWLRQNGGLNLATAEAAALHMAGAANEVAELFLAALERCVASPGSPIQAGSPVPAPTPAATSPSCSIALAAPRAAQRAAQAAEAARRAAETVQREGGALIDEAQRWIGDRAREWLP